MTQVGDFISSQWKSLVSSAQPLVSSARPVVTEWCTRGVNFANSLDTDGKARFAFYQHVRDRWINEPAVSNLCSRLSQYAFKDHPIRFLGTTVGVLFVIDLVWRPFSEKN